MTRQAAIESRVIREAEQVAARAIAEREAAIAQGSSELPGCQRMCRHALTGEVSYRLCTRLFQCAACPFEQMLQERER